MDTFTFSGLIISLISMLFILLAFVTATLGVQLIRPIPLITQLTTRAAPAVVFKTRQQRTVYGTLLLASAAAWVLTATLINQMSSERGMDRIHSLPPSAAGAPPQALLSAAVPEGTEIARAVLRGEALAETPHSADFKKLKKHLSRLLLSAPEFDDPEKPIKLNLSTDQYRDTIRYLAEEYPGLLSMVYHRQINGEPQVVVYYPNVAGNQLHYIPLSGPMTQALSQLGEDGG